MITFEVAPVIHKTSTVFTDDRGRVVRDLRREKQEAAQRAAEEEQQPRKTLEGEQKKAEMRAKTNRMIENACAWRIVISPMIPQDFPPCYYSSMRNLAVLVIHLIATLARLLGPGGVRSLVAESLLLKHQLRL